MIYIGEKVNTNNYCSAINMSLEGDKRQKISQNSQEYWVHDCIFNTEVRIRKSSQLGNDIKVLIASGSKPKKIYKAIDLEILKNHISIEDVYVEIENLKKEFVNLGKEEKQAEIKYALGIY
jgi:cell division protein FtsL